MDRQGIVNRIAGFTLVELMVVVIILTILSATGYTNEAAGQTITLDADGNWGGTLL